jgi:chromate reductase
MRILAISGSLRQESINTAYLRAVAEIAPLDMQVTFASEVARLPLFNPDLKEALPDDVLRFHRRVAKAGALIIASPDYAHGMSGPLKNALDWLVGFEPFAQKAVAIVDTAPPSRHAVDALRETLSTMSAIVVEEASLAVPLARAIPGDVPFEELEIVTASAARIFKALRNEAMRRRLHCIEASPERRRRRFAT